MGRRRLKLDLEEIADAASWVDWENPCYLDLESGEVVPVSGEIRRDLERIYKEAYDEEDNPIRPVEEIVAELPVGDWEKKALLEAHQVEQGYGERFIAIPRRESWEAYEDMEDFIDTVQDRRLREKLDRAIRGRGAFRYFKDVLRDYPEERERWFEFEADRERRWVLDWLESEGVEVEEATEAAPDLDQSSPADEG